MKALPKQAPQLKTYSIKGNIFQIPSHYKIEKVLGTGAYGVVVSAYDAIKKKKVAIKKIMELFEKEEFQAKRILREILILKHFRDHENLVTILDLIPPKNFDSFSDVYIVMELMDCDMRFLLKSNQKIDVNALRYIMYQLLKGLHYVHSANVVHRDLKPSNILLDKNLTVKLCDFGLSRNIDDENPEMSTQYVATRWYRAPELLLLWDKSSKSLDVWSVGCILFELLQQPKRQPLFPGKNYLHQLELIMDFCGTPKEDEVINARSDAEKYIRNLPYRPKVPAEKHPLLSEFSDKEALDLLEGLLIFDPLKRITAAEALKHKFFDPVRDDDDIVEYKEKFVFDVDKDTLQDKMALKKMIYEEVMQWNKLYNGVEGDAYVDEDVIKCD